MANGPGRASAAPCFRSQEWGGKPWKGESSALQNGRKGLWYGVFRFLRVPVAQLDRASASGAEGYRFDPCRAYHSILFLLYRL